MSTSRAAALREAAQSCLLFGEQQPAAAATPRSESLRDPTARAAVAEGKAGDPGGGGGGGGSGGGGSGRQAPKTGCAAARAVGSSCSSAPEGAMLPFTPQDELWDQEMELFGGSASSCEVSAVAKRGWSRHPPPLRTVAGGPREKGRGAGKRGAQASLLEAAGRRSTLCPNRAFAWEPAGTGRRALELGVSASRARAWPRAE